MHLSWGMASCFSKLFRLRSTEQWKSPKQFMRKYTEPDTNKPAVFQQSHRCLVDRGMLNPTEKTFLYNFTVWNSGSLTSLIFYQDKLKRKHKSGSSFIRGEVCRLLIKMWCDMNVNHWITTPANHHPQEGDLLQADWLLTSPITFYLNCKQHLHTTDTLSHTSNKQFSDL